MKQLLMKIDSLLLNICGTKQAAVSTIILWVLSLNPTHLDSTLWGHSLQTESNTNVFVFTIFLFTNTQHHCSAVLSFFKAFSKKEVRYFAGLSGTLPRWVGTGSSSFHSWVPRLIRLIFNFGGGVRGQPQSNVVVTFGAQLKYAFSFSFGLGIQLIEVVTFHCL